MALSKERLGRYNPQKPMENRLTDLGSETFLAVLPARDSEELRKMALP